MTFILAMFHVQPISHAHVRPEMSFFQMACNNNILQLTIFLLLKAIFLVLIQLLPMLIAILNISVIFSQTKINMTYQLKINLSL